MPPLSLSLTNLFRYKNKDSLQRLATSCSALHTGTGIRSLISNRSSNKAQFLEATFDPVSLARTAGRVWGRRSTPNMCYSSTSSEDRTNWLWSIYNETKTQAEGMGLSSGSFLIMSSRLNHVCFFCVFFSKNKLVFRKSPLLALLAYGVMWDSQSDISPHTMLVERLTCNFVQKLVCFYAQANSICPE